MKSPKRILKIEGPPGSGKTRELAREACRLVAQDGFESSKLLVLAATPSNRQRLVQAFTMEAGQAGLAEAPGRVLMLDAFCLELLCQAGEEKRQLVSESDAQMLLSGILRERVLPGDVFYTASRTPSFVQACFELLRQLRQYGFGSADLAALAAAQPLESRLPWLAQIARHFEEALRSANLVDEIELLSRALAQLKADDGLRDKIAQQFPAIFIDEAQELSEAQHQLLALLPVQLVFAGHAQFSIRSYRQAKPTLFKNLETYGDTPVTLLPKLSCLRNNEPILALLNMFLPNPVWEAQSTEPERLAEMVRFGAYPDPETEASAMADGLADFVRNERIDGRQASWDDCVILLRSSHYKHHVVNALLQKEIPFQANLLSEALIRLQHQLYDLLTVLDCLQTLGVTPNALWNPQKLQHCLENAPVSWWETQERIKRANRHLRRWLEMTKADELSGENAASSADVSMEDDALSALLSLFDVARLPFDVSVSVQRFIELAADYIEKNCVIRLLDQVFSSDKLNLKNTDMTETQDAFRNNLTRLNNYYRAALNRSLPLAELLERYAELWELNSLRNQSGGVRLLSLHQAQGEEAPFVWIPFMVQEEFPQTRQQVEILSPGNSAALNIALAYHIDEAEEKRLLAVGMSRAGQRLVMSCHQGDAGKPVLPSSFYRTLFNSKRDALGQEPVLIFCRAASPHKNGAVCAADLCVCAKRDEEKHAEEVVERYAGNSQWAAFQKQAAEALFDETDILNLSASSIKTYMTCSRQFYYRHLLRLPQPDSTAATLGSLIHKLMEIFNQGVGRYPYTVERLQELARIMFAFEEESDAFLESGFDERDLNDFKKLGPLALSDLKTRLFDAIRDLDRKGYFVRYGTLKAVQAERELQNIVLPGIERCRFNGKMDAVIQLQDGTWEIVDYKTFRSAYSAGLDTCDKHFKSTLDPLPDAPDLFHEERFADKLSISYPKDYQLPLYYLACQDDPQYQHQLRAVALQIMRPVFAEKPEQGSIRLELTSDEIENARVQLLDDLNRYVVQPILNGDSFSTRMDASGCGSCAYYALCDVDAESVEMSV